MKRLLTSLALVLAFVSLPVLREWPVVRLQAGSVVQAFAGAGVDSLSSTPTNYTITSVTAGNAIIVAIACGTTTTTFAASDASNGAYANTVASTASGVATAIKSFRGSVGGVTSVAVTSSTTCNGVVWIYQVSGLDNSASPTTGTQTNTTATSHECSSAGISGTSGFSVCAAMQGAGVLQTEGSGWTKATTPNNARFSQYRTTTISSDQGPFTSASNDSGTASMAFFAEAATVRRGLLMGIFP